MAAAGIGEGLREGVKTYRDFRQAADDKQRRIAEMGLMGQKQGMLYDPDAGTFSQGPTYKADSQESVAARNRTRGLLNAIKPGIGNEAITDDWTARELDDKQSHIGEFIKAKTQKDPMQQMNFRDEQLFKRFHDRLLTKLDNNKPLQDQLKSITVLRNATALTEKAIAEGKAVTGQQFADLQQSVLRNLGISGIQTYAERHQKELGSLGINADKLIQFWTGKPQDIGKDNPLYKHVQDMARWQSGNLANQYEEQIRAVMEGHESDYDEHPRLRADLDKKVARMIGMARGREYKGAGDTGAGIKPASVDAGSGLLSSKKAPAPYSDPATEAAYQKYKAQRAGSQ